MKARIKTLGLIVEVTFSHATHDKGHDIIWYKTPQGAFFTKDELEFITTEDDLDYWTRLGHQYAGMAMQGILSDNVAMEQIVYNQEGMIAKIVANFAVTCAHALVQKMKEEENGNMA